MSVGEFCNREVVVVERDTPVTEAINLMRAAHVGNVVVVETGDEARKPVGILTDRDVVIEILAEEVDVGSVSVGDVMSFDLLTVEEGTDLMDVIKMMRDRGVRRIPVVNQSGGLEGILTVDDIVDVLAEQLSDLARLITREQRKEQRNRS